MAIGTMEGTLTRQYQIGDLVVSAAAVSAGMTATEAQTILDEIATPHGGLAQRLFVYDAEGTLVEDEMVRACRENRNDAPILVWTALLLADHRIAEAVEQHLTDSDGRFDPDRFNASNLTEALGPAVGTRPEKAASNILRYSEVAGLVRARRHGPTIVGIDRILPPGDAVPAVLTLLIERLPYIEGEAPIAADHAVDFAVERGLNRWIGLTEGDFRQAAQGLAHREPLSGDEMTDSSEAGLNGFKPKDNSEYLVTVEKTTITKSRHHETLVNDYAEWISNRGYETASPHPIDLTLSRDDDLWLVEAKVLYKGNATDAVRAAIGQLLTYRFMHYRTRNPSLVGLFSESVGDGYVGLLDSLDIIVVWRENATWAGSALAIELGMAASGSAAG